MAIDCHFVTVQEKLMSAGPFETGKYEDNSGNVWECRVQPETKELELNSVANAYTTESITAGLPTLPVNVSSRRKFGIKMRSVTIELTEDGTGSTADYEGEGTRFTIPVFSPTVWGGYSKGQTGTYLGIACTYKGKSSEEVI
jgi:hypothetical protein